MRKIIIKQVFCTVLYNFAKTKCTLAILVGYPSLTVSRVATVADRGSRKKDQLTLQSAKGGFCMEEARYGGEEEKGGEGGSQVSLSFSLSFSDLGCCLIR